tara:strand:+ start:206 stop:475 length:270 start_codon:yes stop_codon:yes gene_type:complete
MYKLLLSILLCSCVSLSTHKKNLKEIKNLEFEVASCNADIQEFQRLMLKLEEANFRNKICKQRVHKCSLQLEEVYEILNDARSEIQQRR